MLTILRWLLAGAWKPFAWALAALGLYAKGRSDARRETALQAAERQAKAERERVALDADIQQDDDLADRARRAGIVRGDK